MENKTNIWLRSAFPWLISWFLLNLIQAFVSELARDEAYYWGYAQFPDWGYYDHPPGVAFIIGLGSWLIPGELGVRILVVLLTTASHWLCYKVVKPSNLPLYFTLVFSPLLLHIAGFIATPDVLILFTSTLFFYWYQQFLKSDTLGLTLLLALTVAAMGYSKYDGVLVLVFSLLAFPQIAKRGKFWLLLLIATLLYAPHLYWQYAHDWITIQFHLTERMPEPYSWLFPLSFPAGQFLVYGGLVSPLIFWAVFNYQQKDTFERVLRYAAFGVLGFFFAMTLKGRVEANWTISVFLPIAYLSYHYLKDKPSLHQWIYRLSVVSIILVMALRLYLLVEFIPRSWTEKDEFHGWPEWSEQLAAVAEDRTVVFYNTYAYSSQYWFYTKKPAYSFSTLNYKGDQYDLWTDLQEGIQGEEVLILSNYFTNDYDSLWLDERVFPYKIVKNYYSYNRLAIDLELPKKIYSPSEKVKLQATISNPTDKVVNFSDNTDGVKIRYDFFHFNRFASGADVEVQGLSELELAPKQAKTVEIEVIMPLEAKEYRFRLGLKSSWQPAGRNMSFKQIEVKKL